MNVETASRLVKLRKKSGLSQEELAEKIGVSRQAISKWERAESSPDTDNLISLAKTYGISIDAMLNQDQPIIGVHESSRVFEDSEPQRIVTQKRVWKRFPYPVLVTIIYLLLGYFGYWHPGWLIFLTIPLWAFFVGSDEESKRQRTDRKTEKSEKSIMKAVSRTIGWNDKQAYIDRLGETFCRIKQGF